MTVSLTSFQKRLLSGVILAPLALILIVLGGMPFMAMVACALLIALYEFLNLVDKEKYRYISMIFAFLYLLLCFSSFIFVRMGFDQGLSLAMALIVCVWASDTGAYFIGKAIGGAKMAPKLSPNKTWAGLCGAMISCALSLIIIDALIDLFGFQSGLEFMSIFCIFVSGLILGGVGQAGDLLISFFKRRAGVSDTGHLIPGHGGLLDRIDSLLLVSPVFLGILIICQ